MRIPFVCLVFSVFSPCVIMAQAVSDVKTPQKRAETLDLVRNLLTVNVSADTHESILDRTPFKLREPAAAPVTSVATDTPAAAGAVADRELLIGIAEGINPSGTMQLDNTQILLFGQKKFKVGDRLPIIFQGTPYELQVTAIERTSFTLRLNSEEITRPIKPVLNKP